MLFLTVLQLFYFYLNFLVGSHVGGTRKFLYCLYGRYRCACVMVSKINGNLLPEKCHRLVSRKYTATSPRAQEVTGQLHTEPIECGEPQPSVLSEIPSSLSSHKSKMLSNVQKHKIKKFQFVNLTLVFHHPNGHYSGNRIGLIMQISYCSNSTSVV